MMQGLQLEKMDNCRIHPLEKVIFVCMRENCPDKEEYPLYCIRCDIHDHKNVLIEDQIKNVTDDKWLILKRDIENLSTLAKEKYDELKPIIEHLEKDTQPQSA